MQGALNQQIYFLRFPDNPIKMQYVNQADRKEGL